MQVEVYLESLWKFSWVLCRPFAFSVSSCGYSPMDLKRLNNICSCSQRNIRLLGDDLISFTFNMLVYNTAMSKYSNSNDTIVTQPTMVGQVSIPHHLSINFKVVSQLLQQAVQLLGKCHEEEWISVAV